MSVPLQDVPPPEPASVVPDQSGRCPLGMTYVDGDFCPGLAQTCKRFIDEKMDRCAEYFPASRCIGPSFNKEFCIDMYE